MAILTGKPVRQPHRGPAMQGCCWVLALTMALWSTPAQPAQDPLPLENRVKAVFLFRFAQFVNWPPQAFAEAKAPLIIGVLGDDPFGEFLDATVGNERIEGHPLIVQRFPRPEDLQPCHILFISAALAGQIASIPDILPSPHILTVSDADGFCLKGGIIRFVTDQGKIRFRVNLQAAKAAGLTLSSKLLRPAQIVKPGED